MENLRDSLDRAAEREERLVSRLEKVLALVSKIERNQADIKEIHGDLYGERGLLVRVHSLEAAGDSPVPDEGGVRLSGKSVVSIGLFLVGAAFTALWHIVEWVFRILERIGS